MPGTMSDAVDPALQPHHVLGALADLAVEAAADGIETDDIRAELGEGHAS